MVENVVLCFRRFVFTWLSVDRRWREVQAVRVAQIHKGAVMKRLQGVVWGIGTVGAMSLFHIQAERWATLLWVVCGSASFLLWAWKRRAVRRGIGWLPMVGIVLALVAVGTPSLAGCGMPRCHHASWPFFLTLGWVVAMACFSLGNSRWVLARGVLACGALWGCLAWMGVGYASYDAATAATFALAVWPLGAALMAVRTGRLSLSLAVVAAMSFGAVLWVTAADLLREAVG